MVHIPGQPTRRSFSVHALAGIQLQEADFLCEDSSTIKIVTVCSSHGACCCNELITVQVKRNPERTHRLLQGRLYVYSCYAAWRILPLVSVSGLLIGRSYHFNPKHCLHQQKFQPLEETEEHKSVQSQLPIKVYPLVRAELNNIKGTESCWNVWEHPIPPPFVIASFSRNRDIRFHPISKHRGIETQVFSCFYREYLLGDPGSVFASEIGHEVCTILVAYTDMEFWNPIEYFIKPIIRSVSMHSLNGSLRANERHDNNKTQIQKNHEHISPRTDPFGIEKLLTCAMTIWDGQEPGWLEKLPAS